DPAGGRALGRRRIHTDRPRAAPREPRREVRRAATELDDVEAVDVAEDADLVLGDREHAPEDVLRGPVTSGRRVRELGVLLRPLCAVGADRAAAGLNRADRLRARA